MRILAVLAAIPLMACTVSVGDDAAAGTPGTGSGNTRSYAIAGFDAVSLKGSDDVDVRVGTAFSVRAEGPSDELDKLVIDKSGTTLRIGRKSSMGMSWGKHDPVTVFVTMPRIAAATVAGSGDLKVDRAEGDRFRADAAGSGDLSIGTLAVTTTEISLAGSGNIAAAGITRDLKISIAGSGDVAAKGLKASKADISIAGSGSIVAAVDGPASVSIVGSGDVALGAKAKCTTSKMGSGTVTCG